METYTAWAKVPKNLKTKTQLAEIGLRPAKGQAPVAFFDGHWGQYDLFDAAQAVEKRKPSAAALAALARARDAAAEAKTARCTCERCGNFYEEQWAITNRVCFRCRDQEIARAQVSETLGKSPLFLDTETTGLDGQIVDVAIVDVDGSVLLNTLVRATIAIEQGAQAVHGISDADIATAPSLPEVLAQINEIVAGRTVVIYNAPFDVAALKFSALAAGTKLADFESVCAMRLFAVYFGEWSNYWGDYKWQSLQTAAMACGVVPTASHRAFADAEVARQVFLRMATTTKWSEWH